MRISYIKNTEKEFIEKMTAVGGNHFYYHYLADPIYRTIDSLQIGKSVTGTAMDAAGRNFFNHRLVGHHIFSDFPIDGTFRQKIEFLEHLASDFPTKQGLPILSQEFLENHPGIMDLALKIGPNWTTMNMGDTIFGAYVLYRGISNLHSSTTGQKPLDSEEAIKKLFISGIILSSAIVAHNPIALIGALIDISATIHGCFNDPLSYLDKLRFESCSSIKAFDSCSSDRVFDSYDPTAVFDSCKILGI